jgi:hypothetical protein
MGEARDKSVHCDMIGSGVSRKRASKGRVRNWTLTYRIGDKERGLSVLQKTRGDASRCFCIAHTLLDR